MTLATRRGLWTVFLVLVLVGLVWLAWPLRIARAPENVPQFASTSFDGERALAHVADQVAFGPRPPGSAALLDAGDLILATLEAEGWETDTQTFTYNDTPIRNLIGRAAIGQGPIVIVGAHYDTRLFADADPDDPRAPMVGANDGGSGVGVLLELARALDVAHLEYEVWLVFFDAEDNGGIYGWDWIVGSTYFVSELRVKPLGMILVDLVGDADQQLFIERNSTPEWSALVWQTAAELGYAEWFIDQPKYSILDDHIPFLRAGIPAVNIIDFDYPYWHTTQDTLDKLSADSLERVGRTVETILEQGLLPP